MLRKALNLPVLTAALLCLSASARGEETEFPAQDPGIQSVIQDVIQQSASAAPDSCVVTTNSNVEGTDVSLIQLMPPFNVSGDGEHYVSFPGCAPYWNFIATVTP